MLRRIEIKDPWRSLDQDFWGAGLRMGSRTVVYGHNGSGKSTLAELLLGLAEGRCTTRIVWEHEDGRRTSIGLGKVSPPASMAVFTRKWVDQNLSSFLDGASASAIVTLGKAAIDARDEEARLTVEIESLRGVEEEAAKQHKATSDAADKLARDVQDRIVSELKEFDYNHFTKNRYTFPKIQDDLREYTGGFPDSDAHTEALKRLGAGALVPVPQVTEPPTGITSSLTGLAELLAETPTRVAIEALQGEPRAQTWVEQGIALHKGLDQCLFCTGDVDSARREQLARHFDESWLEIRGKATRLLSVVADEKRALAVWGDAMPATALLSSDLQSTYADAVKRANVEVDERVATLEAVEGVLGAKAEDPTATPVAPDWSVLTDPPSTSMLAQAIGEHNDQARRHEEVSANRQRTVLDHLVGSQSQAFRDLEQQAEVLAIEVSTSKQALEVAERTLVELRQSQFTTKDMADRLTSDLARVYGKNHLKVAVTPDGKSYACKRGDKPGTDLSHGERTTLSLLYFLRKLEDEQVHGGVPSERIVVIDDPSSSLDREALFATHQWLIDTLNGFGQYIILTHDFGLLRLFITSQRTAWGRSMKRIREGNVEEIRFPRVSFLEMYAASIDGERRSRVGELPRVLLSNTSEYAYLFSMVMAGIANADDHERLFLLPNAARRVMEVFASYKAPHRTDFIQQLEALVESQDGEPFRDVYDFCNRYSHGEGSESIDVLDARAVHGQIRRCMEFLRSVDSEHFARMCTATRTDPATLT